MKHRALLQKLKRAEKTADEIRKKLNKLILMAECTLRVSKIEFGREKVQEIWESTKRGEESLKPPYKTSETCTVLDEAFLTWELVFSRKTKIFQNRRSHRRPENPDPPHKKTRIRTKEYLYPHIRNMR